MDIIYSKSAIKLLKELDVRLRTSILNKIKGLSKIPPEGDIKQLKGYSDNYLRLRVGKYRIIFKHIIKDNNKYIAIVDIGSRGDIYK